DRQHPPTLPLCLSGSDADHTASEVNLLPQDAPKFVFPCASVVGADEQRLEALGQAHEELLVLIRLQEPLADVILFELRYGGPVLYKRRVLLCAKRETSAHNRQLPVDRGLGGIG